MGNSGQRIMERIIEELKDCSQTPIFPRDSRYIARFTVNCGHLDFQMYRGGRASGIIALDLDDLTGK